MANRFEGIYPPLIASFTEDGDLYEKGFRNVIRYLMGEGVHGFFINGSYGSAVLMTIEERGRRWQRSSIARWTAGSPS